MKKELIVYILILISLGSFSQRKVDSLQNLLEKADNKEDSLNVLTEIAEDYEKVNTDKAIHYSIIALQVAKNFNKSQIIVDCYNQLAKLYWKKAYKKKLKQTIDSSLYFANKTGYVNGLARALYLNGLYYIDMNQFVKAENELNKSLKYFNEIEDYGGVADSYHRLGIIYWERLKLDSAISLYTKSFEYYEKSGDLSGKAKICRYKGIVYNRIGQYPKALDCYYSAEKQYRELGDRKKLGEILGNIGSLQKKLNHEKKALESFQTAYEIFKKLKLKRPEAGNLSQIAYIHFLKGNYKLADSLFHLAYNIYDSIGFDIGRAEVLTDISELNYKRKKYDEGIKKLGVAKNIFNKIKYENGLIRVHKLFGMHYNKKGDKQKALTNLQLALKYAVSTQNKEQKKELYKLLSDFYSENGNYKEALKYYRDYKAVSDSLVNAESKKHISRIQRKYDFIKKQKELESLKNEQKLEKQKFQRNILLLSVLLLIIVIAFILNSYYSKKKSLRIIEEKNKELERARVEAIKANQLKSAFLANMSHEIRTPMSAVIGFSELLENPDLTKKEQHELIESIQENSNRLLELINDIIDTSRVETESLSISKVKMDLSKTMNRLEKKFKTKYISKLDKISFQIKEDNLKYIFMDPIRLEQVLNNLIDNAFKFTEEGRIEVRYRQEKINGKEVVKFDISDTGCGIPEENQQDIFDRFSKLEHSKTKFYQGTGLGLALARYLVNKLGGNIYVNSQPGSGSVFTFYVPTEEP